MSSLPWFKFSPSEWLSGDISSLSYETQGIFIKICSLYWKQGCSLDKAKLKRRLSIATALLDQCLGDLVDENIVKFNGDSIAIKFLDEQYTEFADKHVRRVNAGRKGGNATAKLKQGYSNKEEEGEEDKEVEREEEEESASSPSHALKIFKDLGCYTDGDEEWFESVASKFTSNFVCLCIDQCKDDRRKKKLKPMVCKSDLQVSIETNMLVYSEGSIYRETS